MPSPRYQSLSARRGERTSRSGTGASISLAVRPDSLSGSQTPLSECPGTMSLVTTKNPGGPRAGARTAGPDLTRGARGLRPLGWPSGHRDAAAWVPQMLLLRCRCPIPGASITSPPPPPPRAPFSRPPLPGVRLQDRQRRRRGRVGSRGGGGARSSSPSCTGLSGRGGSRSTRARLRFPGEGSGLGD